MLIGERGVSRIGTEFWPVIDDSGSQKKSLVSCYDDPVPTMDCTVINLPAPGPNGAISAMQPEALCEGALEAEAWAFIEKTIHSSGDRLVLADLSVMASRKALEGMLGARVRILNAYRGIMERHTGSLWAERSDRIYEAAAKVARAIDSAASFR